VISVCDEQEAKPLTGRVKERVSDLIGLNVAQC
jgi:hypothetical protein